MYKYLPIILLLTLLTGCQLYALVGVHDRSFDSEYQQDNVITTFGASQELSDNFEVYGEHTSMPFYREEKDIDGGYGVNEIGIRTRYKFW